MLLKKSCVFLLSVIFLQSSPAHAGALQTLMMEHHSPDYTYQNIPPCGACGWRIRSDEAREDLIRFCKHAWPFHKQCMPGLLGRVLCNDRRSMGCWYERDRVSTPVWGLVLQLLKRELQEAGADAFQWPDNEHMKRITEEIREVSRRAYGEHEESTEQIKWVVNFLIDNKELFFMSCDARVQNWALTILKDIIWFRHEFFAQSLPLIELALQNYRGSAEEGGRLVQWLALVSRNTKADLSFLAKLPATMAPAFIHAARMFSETSTNGDYRDFVAIAAHICRLDKETANEAWALFKLTTGDARREFVERIEGKRVDALMFGFGCVRNIIVSSQDVHEEVWEFLHPHLVLMQEIIAGPPDEHTTELFKLFWELLATFANNKEVAPLVFDFITENPEVLRPLRELPRGHQLKGWIFLCTTRIKRNVPDLEEAIKQLHKEHRVYC